MLAVFERLFRSGDRLFGNNKTERSSEKSRQNGLLIQNIHMEIECGMFNGNAVTSTWAVNLVQPARRLIEPFAPKLAALDPGALHTLLT